MLPPKEVPAGLAARDYLKLQYRYLFLGWYKQSTKAMRLAIAGSPDPNSSAEGQKRAQIALSVLESTFFLKDTAEGISDTVNSLIDYGITQADQALDKFAAIKSAKDSMKGVFSTVKSLARDSFDKVMEDLVLPGIGLPTKEIPQGLSQAQYLSMALQYERLGLPEQLRKCLEQCRKVAPASADGYKAIRFLRTKAPVKTVPLDASRRNMEARQLQMVGKEELARGTLEDLVRDYPEFEWPYVGLSRLVLFDGEIERAERLAKKATELNPSYINAWLGLATIHIIHWNIDKANKCVETANSLDSEDKGCRSFKHLLEHIDSQGLRV